MNTQLTLIPELQRYDEEFARIVSDIHALADDLNDRQFNIRLHLNEWSISDCLMHLVKSGEAYYPLFDAAIAEAKAHNRFSSAGQFTYGFLATWFIKSLEPPVKTKMKTPKAFAEENPQKIEVVLPKVLEVQEKFREYLHKANGLDLARVKVRSPFAWYVRYGIGAAFALTAAHCRRHIWQAWNVRKDDHFPKH